MPKPKPTQVIRHEIVLGRSERDLLEPIIYANVANKLANPIVEILKDTTAIYAIVTLIELYTDIDFPIPTFGDASELWDGIAAGIRTARENKATYSTPQEVQMAKLTIANFLKEIFQSDLGETVFNEKA